MKTKKQLEKEILEIDLEHGKYMGFIAEDCPREDCIDRDKVERLKATLTQTNEIIELIEKLKYKSYDENNNVFYELDVKELLTKIKGDGE